MKSERIDWAKRAKWAKMLKNAQLSHKKMKTLFLSNMSKSRKVLDLLTYSRETWFSFSYGKVGNLDRLIGACNEIDRVSKFDIYLSFGAKQNALRQIFFVLWFFKYLFTNNLNGIFVDFFSICVGSINKCIYIYLSMQI